MAARVLIISLLLNHIIGCGEAVCADSIYWSDFGSVRGAGDIRRSPLTGGSRLTLASKLALLVGPTLDVGDGLMYWGDNSLDATIQRANLDGTGRTTLISGLYSASSPALDLAHGQLYWADGELGGEGRGDIRRANLDGSNPVTLVTGLSDPTRPALDLTAGKMYWANSGLGEICRANLDGTGMEVLQSNLVAPSNVALDFAGGKIYWADTGQAVGNVNGDLRRANLDGSGPQVLVRNQDQPSDVALDMGAGKIYWTDLDGGDIRRANLDGTSATTLITGLAAPSGLALDVSAPAPISPNVPEPTGIMMLCAGSLVLSHRRWRVASVPICFLAAWLTLGSLPQSVSATPFSRMVVFGDSLSDEGNASFYSSAGYFLGRRSNGPVWVEDLASTIGVPSPTASLGGGPNATNFAYAGATAGQADPDFPVPTLGQQVGLFLQHNAPAAGDLYVIDIGNVDVAFVRPADPAPRAAAIASQVTRLAGLGAKSFLIANLYPLGDIPHFVNTSAKDLLNNQTDRFNQDLSNDVATLRTTLGSGVSIYSADIHQLVSDALANPAQYGLTNVTQAAHDVGAGDPDHYMWWDINHPTTAFHQFIAQRAADALKFPGDANNDGRVDFADLLILAQNYGKSPGQTFSTGDFNQDGAVGFDDLLILAQDYGRSLAMAGKPEQFAEVGTVPEPSTAFVAASAGAVAFAARRRR